METKDRAAPRQEGDKAGGEGGSRRYTHPYIQKSRAHWGWDCGYDEPWEGELARLSSNGLASWKCACVTSRS